MHHESEHNEGQVDCPGLSARRSICLDRIHFEGTSHGWEEVEVGNRQQDKVLVMVH